MISKRSCTGCSACSAVCPKNAIKMVRDEQGFIYPWVDQQLCISCGLCDGICPINKKNSRSSDERGFACSLKDKAELFGSTSGGVFFAAAEYMIQSGGLVYGAAYAPFPEVRHIRADSLSTVERMRKSKYTQSQTDGVFRLVKNDLDNGKPVLFSGLPCQIAGLKQFIKKGYEKLITIQLFCSGVISEEVWKQYLEFLENKFGSRLTDYISRYKSDGIEFDCFGKQTKPGWKNPYVKVMTEEGVSYIMPRSSDPLTIAYAKHLGERYSCGECKYKLESSEQYADISIGDFWGCENNAPDHFEPQGVSAVIVHTDKGNAFLNSLSSRMNIASVSTADIYKGNPGACKPCPRDINADGFMEKLLMKNLSFDKLVNKYAYGIKYGKDYSELHLKIGIWGSYNLRASVLEACLASESSLVFQYSNSSLISLMSSPVEIGDISLPTNPFRSSMLKNDFEKTAVRDENILNLENIDYLVIDFLEERFKVCKAGGSFITVSDALMDTDYKIESAAEFDFPLWKEKCLLFIDILLKRGFENRIILVETYLTNVYRNEAGKSISFDNKSYSNIDYINERLRECYIFFRQNCPSCRCIQIEQENLMFCQNAHRHGMYPWHLNDEYYNAASKLVLEIIAEE